MIALEFICIWLPWNHKILIFKLNYLRQKLVKGFWFFFLLKNIRLEVQLVIITFFDNFNFGIGFFSKIGPYFGRLIGQIKKLFDCNNFHSVGSATLYQQWGHVLQGASYWNVLFELALTDRNMQAKICLKVVLTFWDWGNWVSSTSYRKSNIGWPQQPPTENVQKFNMTWQFKRYFIKRLGPLWWAQEPYAYIFTQFLWLFLKQNSPVLRKYYQVMHIIKIFMQVSTCT